MEVEFYDDLKWVIGSSPTGASTPDHLFELTYDAYTRCPHCEEEIVGTASYHSENEDMSHMWLAYIEYDECDCEEYADEEDDDDF